MPEGLISVVKCLRCGLVFCLRVMSRRLDVVVCECGSDQCRLESPTTAEGAAALQKFLEAEKETPP